MTWACNTLVGVLHENVEKLRRIVQHLTDPISRRVFDTPRRHIDAPPLEGS